MSDVFCFGKSLKHIGSNWLDFHLKPLEFIGEAGVEESTTQPTKNDGKQFQMQIVMEIG